MNPRVAVLDDYQNVARSFGDWSRLDGRAELTVFSDHLAGEEALAAPGAQDVEAWLDGAPIRRILSSVVPDKLAHAPK